MTASDTPEREQRAGERLRAEGLSVGMQFGPLTYDAIIRAMLRFADTELSRSGGELVCKADRDFAHAKADAIIALASDRRAQGDGEGWRDIASAPMDGTAILVFVPEYHGHKENPYILNVFRGGAAQWMVSGVTSLEECVLNGEPTHWMYLPGSPPIAAVDTPALVEKK